MAERPPRVFAGLLLVLCLLALLAPWIRPLSPNEQLDPAGSSLVPPMTRLFVVRLEGGINRQAERIEASDGDFQLISQHRTLTVPRASVLNLDEETVTERRTYWMGTDKLGRDVFSRWLTGARISLLVAFLVVLLASAIGVVVGALAALGPRWLDGLLMRCADGLLAFPWIFLIITLSVLFPSGVRTLVLLLGATTWMGVARLTRSEILSLLGREHILAARGLGASPAHIFWVHLLPNILPTLLVAMPLRIGAVILFEASLSFLGLGIQPPEPSWGNMIADGRGILFRAWWVVTFPAAALVLSMISLNLLSDHLRFRLDPRSQKPSQL